MRKYARRSSNFKDFDALIYSAYSFILRVLLFHTICVSPSTITKHEIASETKTEVNQLIWFASLRCTC